MWCQGCEWKDFESTHHLAAVVRSIKCAQVDCTLHFPEHVSSAEGPDPCELAQNPRYRKGPDVCFDSNENVSSFVPETALWWSFTVGLRQLLPAFHLHESNHCELFSFWYVDTCVDFINISFSFILHVIIFVYLLLSHFTHHLFDHFASTRRLLSVSGWALVSDQQRVCMETHTSHLVSAAQLWVSVTMNFLWYLQAKSRSTDFTHSTSSMSKHPGGWW